MYPIPLKSSYGLEGKSVDHKKLAGVMWIFSSTESKRERVTFCMTLDLRPTFRCVGG